MYFLKIERSEKTEHQLIVPFGNSFFCYLTFQVMQKTPLGNAIMMNYITQPDSSHGNNLCP